MEKRERQKSLPIPSYSVERYRQMSSISGKGSDQFVSKYRVLSMHPTDIALARGQAWSLPSKPNRDAMAVDVCKAEPLLFRHLAPRNSSYGH